MKKKYKYIGKAIFLWLTLAFTFLILYFNYYVYQVAFGLEEPYYGMTENMDKWTNPFPILLGIDGFTFLLLTTAFWLFYRKPKLV